VSRELINDFQIQSVPLDWYKKKYPLETPGGYTYSGDDLNDKTAILYEIQALYEAQTLSFYIDLLPIIHSTLLSDYPNYSEVSPFSRTVKLLDVDTRTGVGADLISKLYKGPWSEFIIECDVQDLDGVFFDYAKTVCNHVSNFIVSDVADLETNSYDYIIASHVLEHVDDYVNFCNHLKRVAKKNVFLCCAYSELNSIEGLNIIDDKILFDIGARDIEIKKNWWWRHTGRLDLSIALFKLK
jgi:hypothetical protein